MTFAPVRLFFTTLFLAAAIAVSGGCGENEDDEYKGNGGNPPPISTEICDSNCAVPGACGSHGGVDCSAGPDIDASVICEDGNRDSSIKYNCF